MTEGVVRDPFSPGAMMRAEREKQGLHIAALAAAIKVAPRKLDALENDRWAELPDATFTRALAQTVCRTLKMDPKPVLERLPAVGPAALDSKPGGLNAPFNDRGSSSDGAAALVGAIRPMAWAGVVLMVAAVALYLFPPSWLPVSAPRVAVAPSTVVPMVTAMPASAPAIAAPAASALTDVPLQPAAAPMMAASAASGPLALPPVTTNPPATPTSAPQVVVPPAVLMAMPVLAPIASPPPAAAPPGLVQLRAHADSWVQARDGRGKLLLSRMVASGEELGIDGALPIRLTIGNAQATTLAFRGQPVDLQSRSRDNVARVELQ
jgi:cytoskeleton protein RodZ